MSQFQRTVIEISDIHAMIDRIHSSVGRGYRVLVYYLTNQSQYRGANFINPARIKWSEGVEAKFAYLSYNLGCSHDIRISASDMMKLNAKTVFINSEYCGFVGVPKDFFYVTCIVGDSTSSADISKIVLRIPPESKELFFVDDASLASHRDEYRAKVGGILKSMGIGFVPLQNTSVKVILLPSGPTEEQSVQGLGKHPTISSVFGSLTTPSPPAIVGLPLVTSTTLPLPLSYQASTTSSTPSILPTPSTTTQISPPIVYVPPSSSARSPSLPTSLPQDMPVLPPGFNIHEEFKDGKIKAVVRPSPDLVREAVKNGGLLDLLWASKIEPRSPSDIIRIPSSFSSSGSSSSLSSSSSSSSSVLSGVASSKTDIIQPVPPSHSHSQSSTPSSSGPSLDKKIRKDEEGTRKCKMVEHTTIESIGSHMVEELISGRAIIAIVDGKGEGERIISTIVPVVGSGKKILYVENDTKEATDENMDIYIFISPTMAIPKGFTDERVTSTYLIGGGVSTCMRVNEVMIDKSDRSLHVMGSSETFAALAKGGFYL